MSLTDLQLQKIKPKGHRFEVLDGDGLYIRIMPTGKKSWVFRYNFNGIPRRMTLGGYPGIGLAEARKRHSEARIELQRGLDPGKADQDAKKKHKAQPTVKNIINELWEKELQLKRSGPETLRLLQKDIIPAWGRLMVSEIKRRDIVLLLDGIVRRGAPITRNRVHSALTRLFNFAAERGVIDDSPCTRIRKLPETSKTRVLSDDELKKLWQALDLGNEKIDMFVTTKLALKLILLTAQRPGEVCGMLWSELDLINNTWTIPASRMKNNQTHVLPLTDMAKGIIEQTRALFGDTKPYVFQSLQHKDISIATHSLSRAILRHRQEIGIETPFTPHDIRRTVRTRFSELHVDEFLAERVLGHKLEGMLAVYNQHDYIPEKRQALEQWERKLSQIVDLDEPKRNGNVISITEARGHGK